MYRLSLKQNKIIITSEKWKWWLRNNIERKNYYSLNTFYPLYKASKTY